MKHKAFPMLVVGVVLILTRLYTTWDIWVVIGALLAIKGLMLLTGLCPLERAAEDVKKKK